nr:MAG TPA: hypothetical protein [Crassvirales sp.]
MLIIQFSVIAGLLFVLVVLLIRTQFYQKNIDELIDYYKKLCESYESRDIKINNQIIDIRNGIIKTNTHIIKLIDILQESNKNGGNNKLMNHIITTVGEISKDTAVISKNLYFAKGNISTICDKLRIKKLGKDRYFGKEYVAPVELNLVKGSDNDIDDNTDSSVDDAAVDNMG